jgi:hypothetical protein
LLLQRAFTLLVLLIGVGLGLLARPWVDAPAAEAAKSKGGGVECIYGEDAIAVLRNTGSAAAEVRQQLFKLDGSVSLDETLTIPAGQTSVLNGTDYKNLGSIRFTAPDTVLIDGATDAGEGTRQVACFAGSRRAN